MNRFYKALETKYQANIEEALAVLELYFNKAVGVGEHPDILEILDKYISVLDENQSKLVTLSNLFNSQNPKSEQENTN